MENKRIELVLQNVTVGVLGRIKTALEKSLKIDDYVCKKNNHSIIINNLEVLEEAKKIILSVDEKIIINEKELKNIYRHTFYLENLDCANCAAKVERLCLKNISCEKAIVDFTTLKIIIETTENYSLLDLQLKIQECAEMVDPRIEVKKTLKKENITEFRIDPKKKKEFIIGVIGFLIFFIFKTIVKVIIGIEDLWVYIVIYAGYIPSYLILARSILYGAYNNIKNARFFDEMFLMSLATITALIVGYYDEALFIIIFYRIGELCQQYAINYSRKSISGLARIEANKAMVEINGQKVEMHSEAIVVGDIICINPGERIALDGIVEEGVGLLDNQALTGESLPVEVKPGSEVFSGSVCIDGTFKIKVTKSHENSLATKIINIVENAGLIKSRSENYITKFAKYYTPFVVLLAFIIAVFLPLIDNVNYTLDWNGYRESLRISMIFLVVSCPCALVLSIPLSFFGGIGCASKNGILIKGSNYLESINSVDTVMFDKTGTLTKGNFILKEVNSISEYSNEDILKYAAYAETTSNHVIAQSIIKTYGKQIDHSIVKPINCNDKRGIAVNVYEKNIYIGRKNFIEARKVKIPSMYSESDYLFVSIDDKVAGYLVIEDEVREESQKIIEKLKSLNISHTIMVTGDSCKVADRVSKQLNIEEYYAEMDPIDKVNKLKEVKNRSNNHLVAFVGDGLNDAPVISVSDIGIAIGGLGSEATTQIADVVLINDDLNKLPILFKIARKTKFIVVENVILALFIKILFLTLSVLNIINNILIFAAIFADVGVSLIAIINSLRTLRIGEKKK